MEQTPWGYSVAELPPIMGAAEFAELTGREGADAQLALDAVSAVIRDYCGWHVAPALDCEGDLTADGALLRVPSMAVSALAVSVGGSALEENEYEWRADGLARVKRGEFPSGWGAVHATWTAGTSAPQLRQLVLGLASGVMDAPKGVSSETAGGVSVAWDADLSRVDSALSERARAVLSPFRIVNGG